MGILRQMAGMKTLTVLTLIAIVSVSCVPEADDETVVPLPVDNPDYMSYIEALIDEYAPGAAPAAKAKADAAKATEKKDEADAKAKAKAVEKQEEEAKKQKEKADAKDKAGAEKVVEKKAATAGKEQEATKTAAA